MTGVSPVATYGQTNFTAQTATAYKTQLDANSMAAQRVVGPFAPRQSPTPAMTITLDPGHIFTGTTLTEVAAQTSGTITAPSGNPRIDRAVIDRLTGALSVVTGTPAASPVPPPVPAGKLPVAQIALSQTTTSITNNLLTDERAPEAHGRGTAGEQNVGTGPGNVPQLDSMSRLPAVDASQTAVTRAGGTRSRTMAVALSDLFVSLLDFSGADPSGVSDSSGALAAANAALAAGGFLVVPAGTFGVAANTTITAPVFFAGGVFKPASGVTLALDGGVFAPPAAKLFDCSAGGAVSALNTPYLNVRWFGARGDGATDDAAPFGYWWAGLMASGNGVNGYVPGTGGQYVVSAAQLNWDVFSRRTAGVTVYGDGSAQSTINVSGVAAAPQGILQCRGAGPGVAAFYVSVRGLNVVGNTAGSVFQVGLENFNDAFNSGQFTDFLVNNNATAGGAVPLELNNVLDYTFTDVVSNSANGPSSSGLKIRNVQFSTFNSCSAGNANAALYFTGGYSFGNVFNGFDAEACNVCVAADTTNNSYNTFNGGTFAYYQYCFDVSTPGDWLDFNDPNFAPFSGTIAATLFKGTSGQRVRIRGLVNIGMAVPAVPASGVTVTNTWGQNVLVNLWGGAVSNVTIGTSFNYGASMSVGSPFTGVLYPMDTITLTYPGGGQPGWNWRPL